VDSRVRLAERASRGEKSEFSTFVEPFCGTVYSLSTTMFKAVVQFNDKHLSTVYPVAVGEDFFFCALTPTFKRSMESSPALAIKVPIVIALQSLPSQAWYSPNITGSDFSIVVPKVAMLDVILKTGNSVRRRLQALSYVRINSVSEPSNGAEEYPTNLPL
jgi:hypothetical protein